MTNEEASHKGANMKNTNANNIFGLILKMRSNELRQRPPENLSHILGVATAKVNLRYDS